MYVYKAAGAIPGLLLEKMRTWYHIPEVYIHVCVSGAD